MFQQRSLFLNIFSIDFDTVPSQSTVTSPDVSQLPSQFRKHHQSKQHPLRGGDIQKILEGGRTLYTGT